MEVVERWRSYPISDVERKDMSIPTEAIEIVGWPGYAVDKYGNVWSCRTFQGRVGPRWKRLKPLPDKDGYLSVVLKNRGKRRRRKIAHLVLEAFVGPRLDGMESCHFPDLDPSNNHVENLRWASHRDNIQDKTVAGTVACGSRHGKAKISEKDVFEIRRLRLETGATFSQIGDRFDISGSHVWAIVTGRYWRKA